MHQSAPMQDCRAIERRNIPLGVDAVK